MDRQHEDLKFKKRVLWLLLFVIFGLFALYFYDSSTSDVARRKASSGRINDILKDTARTRELRALQVQLENAASAPKLDNESAALASLIDRDRKYGVDLVQEMHQEEVADHTKNSDGMDISGLPDEKVNMALLHRKWLSDYDKRLNKQYVEAFLANARDAGYNVLLNDNLEVVAVKRIPQSVSAAPRESLSGGMLGAN